MITLHVVIMVPAVMSGLANVMKDSMVTIAQVNFMICNYCFADQTYLLDFPSILYVNKEIIIKVCCLIYFKQGIGLNNFTN